MHWENQTIQNIDYKKVFKIGGIILIFCLLGFGIYLFNKTLDRIYQDGVLVGRQSGYEQGIVVGKAEIGRILLRQIRKTDAEGIPYITLNLPMSDGTRRIINFYPQIINEPQATTTE